MIENNKKALTVGELSEALGVSRSSVNRCLRSLRKRSEVELKIISTRRYPRYVYSKKEGCC